MHMAIPKLVGCIMQALSIISNHPFHLAIKPTVPTCRGGSLKKIIPLTIKPYFMIPALIYFLIRLYRQRNIHSIEKTNLIRFRISRPVLLILLYTLIAIRISSQEKTLEYQIKRNGTIVGNVHFTQNLAGNRVIFKMESEVKTKFIFTFAAKAKEESIYDNGILTWSSVYRKMNGTVKTDKKMKAIGSAYTVYKNNKSETMDQYPIYYNMLSMYTIEPATISRVFSDNYQQFLDIKLIKDHQYKIEFPDGNYNEYFYENGICSQIKVHHSLYSATIERKS